MHARRDLDDGFLAPNMHSAGQIEALETTGLDAERRVRVALVHQPAAASGAEVAIELTAREGDAAVDSDGALMRGSDGEGWEDGG